MNNDSRVEFEQENEDYNEEETYSRKRLTEEEREEKVNEILEAMDYAREKEDEDKCVRAR